MTQVITVARDGSLFGLDHKRNGLDLAALGRAKKQRVSDVQWNETVQKWFIQFIGDWKLSGERLGVRVCVMAGIDWPDLEGARMLTVSMGHCLYFDEYEEAVAAEVEILQRLQRRGLFHG